MTYPRIWPPFLDWRDSKHWNPAGLDDCVLCERPTPLLSEQGRPCHKTCAEDWFEQNPAAWEFYERRRDREVKKARTRPADDGRAASNPVHAATLTDVA